MSKTVFGLGFVVVALGVVVLCVSTDFDPNTFMENKSNSVGQISGVVIASIGAVISAIGAAAMEICRSIDAAREKA